MTSAPHDARLLERLYRSMLRIRRTEEEIARVYPTDKVKSPVHLAIGQEPVAVGVCSAFGFQGPCIEQVQVSELHERSANHG